jgi:peptide/nickel transport system substrate-binding protein
MKKLLGVFLVVVVVSAVFTLTAGAQQKGPIVDKVYVNVRMQEDIGLKDVAEGLTDIFFYGVDGPVISGLDQATRDKLDLYSVPSGSWALFCNPYPNQAPYLVKADSKEYFNPLAMREVRFALNFLINRKYIVDEILFGSGGPMFTMATPGQPGTDQYNLLANRMGFTEEGDEKRALSDITKALETVAALPELQGRLGKNGAWWTFDAEPVTIKFLIRVDDPQGRMKEGEYVAQQIEKAGIKVERLLWDRAKCSETVYAGNPADYQWNLYTEGWAAGATRAFWEHIVSQMYAPWYGYLPGGNNPDHWNYQHDELNRVTKKAYSGNFLTEDEYWELALKGLELGLQDAVRIYVAYQIDYYAVNKARFNRRMVYGLGDGLNSWSVLTADTKDKILRITGFSAKGALFMHAWDPVGTDGFSDVYSLVCASPAGDAGMFEHPATAIMTPLRVIPTAIDTKVHRDEKGDVVGDLPVPPEAIRYDSAQKVWVQVGADVKAMSTATYSVKFGKFHHSRPIGIADLVYADAFQTEWVNQDGENDRYYDASYSSALKPGRDTLKGWVFHPDQTITAYFDYNFPASKKRVAGWTVPWLSVANGRPNIMVSWEILEALAQLVTEGSASGTTYSFTYGEATEVDLLRPSCVADIRAKLVELKAKQYVPPAIKNYLKPEDAVASYEAAIQWIDTHGHAFISTGPFYVDKYDPATNYMELTAFRDPDYPFMPDYWPDVLATTILRIDSVEIPAMYAAQEKTMPVRVSISEVRYPDNISKPAENGEVTATLITAAEERTYQATYVEPGVFEAVIPVENLEPGSYTLILKAQRAGAVPASTSGSTVIY